MQNLQQNLAHLIMGIVVIVAMVVLIVTRNVSGQEGVTVIIAAGGFSLGAGSASVSATTAAVPNLAASASESPTATQAPSSSIEPVNLPSSVA